MPLPGVFKEWVGESVVVDTDTHLVYIGELVDVGEDHISLKVVDVHSDGDTHSSREIYLLETRRHGIRQNRERTVIVGPRIVSMSKLDDVTDY